jgi:hypothetical protein
MRSAFFSQSISMSPASSSAALGLDPRATRGTQTRGLATAEHGLRVKPEGNAVGRIPHKSNKRDHLPLRRRR